MKAKELAEMLLKYPDFDVQMVISELDNSKWGMTVRTFDIIGIGDIGHSDKVIQLDNEERK